MAKLLRGPWVVMVQKRVQRPWVIVTTARTRTEARQAASLLASYNHVRVTRLLPDEMRTLDGCSTPSGKSNPAEMIAPSVTEEDRWDRINAAFWRGWMAVAVVTTILAVLIVAGLLSR